MTLRLMSIALDTLVNKLEYDVPPQDLRFDLARIPAIPKSRFVTERVHSKYD